MALFIEIVYYLSLSLTIVFSLAQLCLLLLYLFKPRIKPPATSIPWPELPRVTVQLPVFNEVYVIDQLIESIASLQYPADKLEIQILDDSTDETTAHIARKIRIYQQAGMTVEHIRRVERTGFKAGALAYGLQRASGEFIAIFDADFLPEPDFLLRVLPSFTQPDVGVVQTRWLHVNDEYSLLTQLQALGLNAHFIVEQNVRYWAGLFLNFNGTAGLWRKTAILEAGGWHSDTLTEDLDLSYRAQLKGWHIVYRDDVGVPAELPITMSALKSQQYRWMKGPAECARKHLGTIVTVPGVSAGKKVLAGFHLLSSSLFVIILLMALVSIPVLYMRHQHPDWPNALNQLAGLFSLASFVSLLFWGIPFYQYELDRFRTHQDASIGQRALSGVRFLWLYPIFLAVMLGLSLHNSLAVIEGLLGIKTPFVRTPKFNVATGSASWTENIYEKPGISGLVFLEGCLAVYFSVGIGLGLYQHDYSMLGFHSLLTLGFGLVTAYSLAHAWAIQRTPVEPVAVPSM